MLTQVIDEYTQGVSEYTQGVTGEWMRKFTMWLYPGGQRICNVFDL